MRIFFIYPQIDLERGGSAIHGVNLVKCLRIKGHEIYSLRKLKIDGVDLKKSFLLGIIRCELVYVRINFHLKLNLLIRFISLFKKVVVELNAPSDELLLKGYTNQTIDKIDRRLSRTLKKADQVIVVSEAIRKYCCDILGIGHVEVINNGGEILSIEFQTLSNEFVKKIQSFRNDYSKIIVWSGTNYPWQGFSKLKELVVKCDNARIAFIIASNDETVSNAFSIYGNVLTFTEFNRNEMAYIISKSDIGCSFYGDFSKTRTGFYNSSLKFHEYLVNGLGVIASPFTYFDKYKNTNVFCSHNIENVIDFIESFVKHDCGEQRTWEDVAKDTEAVFDLLR